MWNQFLHGRSLDRFSPLGEIQTAQQKSHRPMARRLRLAAVCCAKERAMIVSRNRTSHRDVGSLAVRLQAATNPKLIQF
jgi:hypothetical protein